jgi:hypothetical protein
LALTLSRITTSLRVPLAIALALASSGCGSDDDSNASASTAAPATTAGASGTAVFALDEWTVTEISKSITAGQVELSVTNNGDEVHELVIVRAGDAASLPVKADGSVDEEAIPAADVIGEIADIAPGAKAAKTFDLPPGVYLAFCNIVDDGMMGGSMDTTMGGGMPHGGSGPAGTGHVHFALGMVTTFSVG